MKENKMFRPDKKLKLMDQVRVVLKYHHYAYRTELAYCKWIVRYVKFHKSKKHPEEMGKKEVESFLSNLAVEGNVSAATQKQALNAIIFLYKYVLDINIGEELEPVRAKRQKRLPVVMTVEEVREVLKNMQGPHKFMAQILYGCGLRLLECVRLRVHDIDFGNNIIYVRSGKGGKDRTTVLPKKIIKEFENQISRVKEIHKEDLEAGYGEVYLPEGLSRKYKSAGKKLGWQYVFPSKKMSVDPRTDITRRHHVLESGLQKAVRRAVDKSNIVKRVSCHTFRHSFATHMLQDGVNIRILQELMGHADVKTTEIYTHVIDKDISLVVSPLDTLTG
jgi:integron integrase